MLTRPVYSRPRPTQGQMLTQPVYGRPRPTRGQPAPLMTVRVHHAATGERLWSATMPYPAALNMPPFTEPVITTVILGKSRYDIWPDGTLIP